MNPAPGADFPPPRIEGTPQPESLPRLPSVALAAGATAAPQPCPIQHPDRVRMQAADTISDQQAPRYPGERDQKPLPPQRGVQGGQPRGGPSGISLLSHLPQGTEQRRWNRAVPADHLFQTQQG